MKESQSPPDFAREAREFDLLTWQVIDKYFAHNKGVQLVKHQLDSYNDFVMRKMEQVIEGFNTIEIHHQYVPEADRFRYVMRIDVSNPSVSKPMIQEKDGSHKVMTPSDARQRNFTYAAPLHVDLDVSASTLQEDGTYVTESKRITGVSLGRLPVMVGSRYCVFNNTRPLRHNECRYELGGYFIINGNEKVLISQDRIAENKTYCFVNNKATYYSHHAEIRSVQDNVFGVPKATTLKLSSRSNQFGRFVRVNIHHIKHDIPLFVLFRALGVESDRDICSYVLMGDDADDQLLEQLTGSVEDANMVRTERQALEYLSRYLNIGGYPKEVLQHPDRRIGIVRTVLRKEFLPHAGIEDDGSGLLFRRKALYLGYMVRKLVTCFVGRTDFDDRDSYINKRIDTPGILLTNLFRQYYGKLVKDMRNLLQKEINTGSWKATNRFINVLTRGNVLKIIKPTVIEAGLKYCLATGNWGIKNARNKQGIAQVLNRLTYNATLSHLRRINTPIEKTGKLVQPRKLHSTQWGIICPSETPDGASVGLVKNMALTCGVTMASDSTHVRELLTEEEGVAAFDGDNLAAFATHTWVLVNGDIVGVTQRPAGVYERLVHMKRRGHISVHTGVCWDQGRRELRVSTDSGRCVRPLYVVETGGRLALTRDHVLDLCNGRASWLELVTGGGSSQRAPAIEFLDVEESAHRLLAMRYADLRKEPALSYTHMELHPSLMLGLLTSAIPASDHNQAPRNTYQSAMGKQAVGVYTTNYRDRYDTMAHVLNYPQRPMVRTRTSRVLRTDELPCGQNAIVAIATHSGYNQEDSVIMNASAIDRGMFTSTYYRTYREQNNKNHANGEEEVFTRPNPVTTQHMRPYNYDKLAADGFVPEDTQVESGDVIIGRSMPQKQQGVIVFKDTSVALKNNETGCVDRNCAHDRYFVNTNGEGYNFAKVRLRKDRAPVIGEWIFGIFEGLCTFCPLLTVLCTVVHFTIQATR